MGVFEDLRAGRTEWFATVDWSLSIVSRRGRPDAFDVAVLRNGVTQFDDDSPIGGPWTFLTANEVEQRKAELKAAVCS